MPKKPTMRLTHHSTPSRSFILLTIIVLCTVYAALVLTRINKLYQEELPVTTTPPQTQQTPGTQSEIMEQIPELDSSEWVEYNDDLYPFTIYVPRGWRIRLNNQLENFYLVSVTQTNPQSLIRIFVGNEQPEQPDLTPVQNFTTSLGYEVTNYANTIYQIKVGEVYYTFDGSAAPEAKDVLREIVNSAELK